MAAHVISHRGPRGKRGRARALAARRFAMLALAVAALALASWLAPILTPAPGPAPAPPPLAAPEPPKLQPPATSKPFEAPRSPVPAARPDQRRAAPIPLDAQNDANADDDFEVLSAAELAAISQARDGDGPSQFAAPAQAATTAREQSAGARENVENQGGQSGRRTRRR